MNIYLLFPPHWTPAMPHLALPVLTGHLRRCGHTVTQRDLNAEAFDEILTRKSLRQAVERIRTRFGAPGPARRSAAGAAPDPAQVAGALRRGPQLAELVEKAKAIFRSPAFYDGEASEPAFLTIVEALEVYSLAYHPAVLDLSSFNPAGQPDSSTDLIKGARDPRTNPFYDLFKRIVLPDLRRDKPGLVGISVPTQAQFLPALTLAALIRDADLKCHVTLGGPHISMLREQFPKVPRLFSLIDSVVVFDGEIPLQRLAEALEQNRELAEVPSLIYPDLANRSLIRVNPTLDVHTARGPQETQEPDFDGLPFTRYLAPELVLPLATCHGCYHGKCAFCNVGYGSPFQYFPYPVEHVTGQVERVHRDYGCRHIFFVDEAITPRTLRQLAAAINPPTAPGSGPALQGLADISWTSAARFEKALTDPLLAAIGAAGCRMLLFGLESASEPVMRAMVKGTVPNEMSRILRSGTAAGIWNHTFFFFGFPGETLEDAQRTVDFVYEHQDAIHSASAGAFLLEAFSPAHQDPAAFGITRVHEDPQRDLAIYFEYDIARGLDEETANRLAESFIDQLPDKRFGQFYIQDAYKFLYASELHRRGQPLPRWIE